MSDTDLRINKAIRTALEREGTSAAAFGRRMGVPHSSWMRKISDNPTIHQSYRADEVERIARTLGLTPNDLYSGNPLFARD